MGSALTTYTPNSSRTAVSGMGGAGGGLQGLMEELIRRKLSGRDPHGRRTSGGAGASTTRVAPMGPGREGGDGVQRAQEKAAKAQASMLHSQAKAMAGRAPLRKSFVGGQSVDTPDRNAMTGSELAVHLPGGSAFQNLAGSIPFGSGPVVRGGPFSEGGGGSQLEGEEEMARLARARVIQERLADLLAGLS